MLKWLFARSAKQQPGEPPAPAPALVPAGTAQRRWLLVYNCVTIGLANCLKLLDSRLQLDWVDFKGFNRNFTSWRDRLDHYDLIVTANHFVVNDQIDFRQVNRVRALPVIHFDAYHPDLCYLTHQGAIFKGALGDYHSAIITAAFKQGLPLKAVAGLFNGTRYQRFGYFDRWAPARTRLLQGFADADCPLDRYFSRWGTRSNFMHSVNHPAIRVVYDLAKALLESEGVQFVESAMLPHDNILNGPVFPVYNEIAESLSIPGSYQFKLPADYRTLDLEQFIQASYRLLGNFDPQEIMVHPVHRASFDRVVAGI